VIQAILFLLGASLNTSQTPSLFILPPTVTCLLQKGLSAFACCFLYLRGEKLASSNILPRKCHQTRKLVEVWLSAETLQLLERVWNGI